MNVELDINDVSIVLTALSDLLSVMTDTRDLDDGWKEATIRVAKALRSAGHKDGCDWAWLPIEPDMVIKLKLPIDETYFRQID